ncbi:hypothetical protein SLEP1_g44415 [Rubroshorea leprosula]|uniref:Uncharacterized protein n=1 Tax=Rubroshorea leprosula TaxID=152421 RepID=A0AAV5LHD1_9ROSI|nr:hypothetical protein SLEP1_g44415 [Rubroshorea leprosula]
MEGSLDVEDSSSKIGGGLGFRCRSFWRFLVSDLHPEFAETIYWHGWIETTFSKAFTIQAIFVISALKVDLDKKSCQF